RGVERSGGRGCATTPAPGTKPELEVRSVTSLAAPARPVKASRKPARSLRVVARFAAGLVLSVTEGKATTTYAVARLDSDLGPAYRWEKSQQDGGDVYDVLLGDLDTAPSCECKAHQPRRRARRRARKGQAELPRPRGPAPAAGAGPSLPHTTCPESPQCPTSAAGPGLAEADAGVESPRDPSRASGGNRPVNIAAV